MFTNGVDLHVVMAGPDAGPLVILLHGFPEFWYGWRKQMPALAAAGYHVWAPDQRGYNRSDKPAGVDAYHIDALAKDVAGLIEASGREQVYLVGHDWGAAVAWWVAGHYPARVKKLAILNVPHPAVMRRAVLEDSAQRKKSWYIFYFQLPWLPEWSLRQQNYTNLARTLKGSSRRGAFTADDLMAYRQAWSQPGAVTAMLNWYRAAVRHQAQAAMLGRIRVPTLMIWGAKDIAVGRSLAQPSIDLCDEGRLVFLEEASHWVQHEEPAQVNRLLLEFFGASS
ncbi:MAG: alpha/beta hydrolase [Caldilinea sp.]|uniref:alpha/beta fold hydrolase n=1 Tax=Caldilinea sp. TaxID=2293560 RepID=UPI002C8CE5C5|nr:alpha/beta hydrolase [Caldilinea sp.]